MALPHPSLTWAHSTKNHGKKIHKIGFGCRFVFLLDFKFHFFNKCLIYIGFVAVHPFFFLPQKFKSTTTFISERTTQPECQSHRTFLSPSWQIHDIFASMSDSSRIHVTVTAVLSLQSCHAQVRYIHVIFMGLFPCHLTALGWQIQTWPKVKVPGKCHESAMKVT